MKPHFTVLHDRYPALESREELLVQIGWGDVINKAAFNDTCAIRMSMGLVGAGMALPGARMRAKSGPLRGKSIEPGQARLSNILLKIWGAPEIFKDPGEAAAGINRRSGVISFFRIHGAAGSNNGHIDLIFPSIGGFQTCARSCHFKSVEYWFWHVP